ncbi:MAG: alpha/beta fold hydrolase, partial [Myxococcota bacterium]
MRDLTLSARDGFPLAATLFEPESTTDRIAIVSSATGTPRRYYRHFARALAEAGWTAVTYDYRGIGGSRPDSLRAFEATVLDWALLDMAAIVDWADKTFDRIVMVGHSIGGQ